MQNSFSGLGADAVFGAACSGASMAAADYLTHYQIPQLSPSSTSSALSDRVTYPFFARTPPSDAWQSFALTDLVEHLLKVERVATVNSEDSYGTSGMQEFKDQANRRSIQILDSTSFVNGQADFSSNVDVLRRSGALVVVLFCQTGDASRFIQATQAAGLENITWVGSEAVTVAVRTMVSSSPDQASRLRGLSPRSNPPHDLPPLLTLLPRRGRFCWSRPERRRRRGIHVVPGTAERLSGNRYGRQLVQQCD